MRSVAALKNAYKGEHIIIVGSGASLTKFKWRLLRDAFTIAVNDAIYAGNDFALWITDKPIDSYTLQGNTRANVRVISPIAPDEPDFLYTTYSEGDDGNFPGATCALSAALAFAAHTGCKVVSLIGFDYHNTGGSTRFYKVSRSDVYQHVPDETLKREAAQHIAACGRVMPLLRGIRVCNYSTDSLLEPFVRHPLNGFEELMIRGKRKPPSIMPLRDNRAGKGAVVIACGGSLKKFPWQQLDGLFTIGLNRAIFGPHKLTYWFHTESTEVFERMERRVTELTKTVAHRIEDRPHYRFIPLRHLPRDTEEYQRRFERGHLWVDKTCMVGALEFCRFLGCMRVGILGLDLYCRDRTVYFDETVPPAWRYKNPENKYLKDGRWYPEVWQTIFNTNLCAGQKRLWKHMEIVNYSDQSLCTAFPKKKRAEFQTDRERYAI